MLWTYAAGGFIVSSPALAPDGTVYIATVGALIAVTNNGTAASNRWTFPVQVGISEADGIPASPAIGSDGTIYIGSRDGNLYAVNPDGSQKWACQAQGNSGSPAIGFDGTIYYVGYSYLHAISPSGSMKWKALVGDSGNFCSPALSRDGTIYVGCVGCPTFYAFRPDGTTKWTVTPDFAPGNSAAIGKDGTVYTTGGHLYAFTPDGTNLWHTTTNELRGASPVISSSGTILVADYGQVNLCAFSPAGETLWQSLSGTGYRPPPTCAAIDAAGNIYYCVSNGVWALNSQGAVQWSLNAPGLPSPGGYFAATSPAIGPDGTIYTALAARLYAIGGSNKLADLPWPMHRQNPRHTGKIEKPALQQPKKRSDGNFQFQLYSQLGQTNTVEATSNLSTWTSLTGIVVTNVPMDVVDLTASNFISRFYRVLAP